VEPCPPGLRVRGDRDRIAQILLNLLSTAAKATDPGGALRVWAEDGAGRVRIHVTDSGRGIPVHQHERIFDPFVQLAPENGVAQGVGLGLSISRELARAMHGELEVASEPGVGSTFTRVLPADPGDGLPGVPAADPRP
jgi:signal transduction histidine kinase